MMAFGRVVASGTMDDILGPRVSVHRRAEAFEERFAELAGSAG
jgi:hypothetical protein